MKNITETLVGFLVLLVAGYFIFTAYKGAGLNEDVGLDSYTLNINFNRIDGLNIGGDVKISGLKVGTVTDAKINPETYQASVKVAVSNTIKLPSDSSAEIISAGLLGDKYLSIVPGGSEDYLKDGGTIKFSQSSVSLEALIGKFMFSDKDKKEEN